MSKPNTPEPMDSTVREDKDAAPASNRQRVCWAIQTLREEVWDLFPETPVTYGDYNGRNVALDVMFDLTTLDEDDRAIAGDLLMLIQSDARVDLVIIEHDPYYSKVLVSMKHNAALQDRRESFGLASALDVLTEPDYDSESDDMVVGDTDWSSIGDFGIKHEEGSF